MNVTNCICRNNNLLTDRYQTCQCRVCKNSVHLLCYEMAPFDDRIRNFECLNCRVQSCEPFFLQRDLLIFPFILPTNNQRIEINEHFQLNKQQIEGLISGKLILLVYCTKLKLRNDDEFPYEWPGDGILLSINNRIQLTYHINYPAFLILNEENLLYVGSNTLTIRIPKENRDSIYPRAGLGVALVEKLDVKDVAKEIAKKNTLSIEEGQKKFEALKEKDLEILTSFPIRDPITTQLIFLPARGMKCKHLSCFDLMNFLSYNANSCQTTLRWKCPTCRKYILCNELIIDLYLHQILKEIKADLIAKKWTEDDIDKISFICFDEKGNWKPKQDFSEEWEKTNKNKKKSKENETNSIVLNNNSHQNIESEVLFIQEKKSNFQQIQINNTNSFVEEITVEHCVQIYHSLINLESKEIGLSQIELVSRISSKLKENNIFKNFSASKFYRFLIQANINIYLPSIFETSQNLLENKTLEELSEEISKSAAGEIVLYCLSWVIDMNSIMGITYLLITKDRGENPDMKFAVQLLLIFSNALIKYKYSIVNYKKGIFIVFAELLGNFAYKLRFEVFHFGKIFLLFSYCLPDLNFPFYVNKSKCLEFYENLSDFVTILLKNLDFDGFKKVFLGSHLPPHHEIEEIEGKRLAKHFLYFFVKVFKKRDNLIPLDKIYDLLVEWDIHGNLRDFMSKERLNLTNISLEENELKNYAISY